MEGNTAAAVPEELQPKKTAERRYIRPKELMAYSLTSYGLNNLTTYVNATKQFFMMSFLGLTGTLYGTMSTVSTIWDALDDPLSGVIIDRSRTRWGRLRPFLIAPMPLWAITAILFFSVPGSLLTPQSKFIYATVVTIIYGIGMSYLSGWELLLYNITPNLNERGRLIATNKFMNLFTYLPSVVSFCVDLLPKATNNAVTQQSVYASFSFVFVAIAVVCVLFGFFNMKERVAVMSGEEMQNISIFKSFVSLIKCRPLFVVMLATFFSDVKGVGGASEDFFWLNCTGKLSNRVLCSLFTGFPNYVTTPLTPVLVRKFGLRLTAFLAGIFGGVTYTALYLIGYNPFGGSGGSAKNFIYLVVGLTICGLPNHIMSVCEPLLKGDMYDYLEWTTGMRNEGIVNAVSGYVKKLSGSVIQLVSGLVFDWIKFKPQYDIYGNVIPHTNPRVLKGIFGIFALAPAVSRFGYGLAVLLFNVHGKFKEQMLEDLAVRRLARAKKDEGGLNAVENGEA
ncbi:MAG: MFS transporter [Oscillospiraceae bacterium]|nr:MFS transporter [Oscillospiraceae bacterium]